MLDILPDNFHFHPAAIAPPAAGVSLDQVCYIIVAEGRLLCLEGQPWGLFRPGVQQALGLPVINQHYLGQLHDRYCYALEMSSADELPEGYRWSDLRSQMGRISDALFELAGRALQVIQWHNHHQYCGQCGSPTEPHPEERAKVCTRCKHEFYPRLSPCVITVITRGEYCLLAHNANFPEGYYSALVGFIEVGETVETALHREVMEEVGISVGKLSYFGSQPWPFPGQLMLGFHAEYGSGDITVDGKEILDAQWWRYDELPLVPPASTLSGQLIAHFVAQFKP